MKQVFIACTADGRCLSSSSYPKDSGPIVGKSAKDVENFLREKYGHMIDIKSDGTSFRIPNRMIVNIKYAKLI